MIFGEVVHHVTQPTGWPEPVRGIASLLSSFHCPNKPINENFSSTSSSIISEPLASNETLAPELYTAKDFQILIHSTATELSALAELPHYGSKRSTVPLWSQLLHALANTLSPDVMILEDAPFIMPRAQNVSCQPENLIDGHATLLVAHAIFSAPRTHSDKARTNTQNEEDQDESEEDQDESMCSTDQDESICSADQDESISSADQDGSTSSADSDTCDGSVDSLDLPLQAHMLPGRGRRFSAVVPVLLVADPHNIIPLLCSALYQRHVWGIRQPVVGLCCSSTGTIATAIFGWLESDQSEEGRMPTAHLAFSADFRSDPLMGVFDFTDTSSAISLAQFVLGLRTHFEDIKGATSIEAVDSLTPFRWRSDVPDFETQFWGQSDERVASWTHQVHMQMSSSEVSSSSSSTPRTPSPLLATACVYETMSKPTIKLEGVLVDEENIELGGSRAKEKGRGKATLSAFSNSQFAAMSDTGLGDGSSITNWLFERLAFTIACVEIKSEEQAENSGINAMVKVYDKMTAFTWSKYTIDALSKVTVDEPLADLKLCYKDAGHNSQSNESAEVKADIDFILGRLNALLHAVKNARCCDEATKVRSVNEADRRQEWDALLVKFFKPFPFTDRRDVLLERKLNLARNPAADDSSFAKKAIGAAEEYRNLCVAQHDCVTYGSAYYDQSDVAQRQALGFVEVTKRRTHKDYNKKIATHSSKDPTTGICDAVLVIPISGGATAIISGSDKQKMKDFMLVQNPNPEKPDAGKELTYEEFATSHKTASNITRKTASKKTLNVPSAASDVVRDHEEKSKIAELYHGYMLFRSHPDGKKATQEEGTMPSTDELLLPVLLAEYKKKDGSAVSTAMNQMRTYQVSAVTFLSTLGITDQPVFGLIVNGTLGAITMAWKTNDQTYVMERNVRHYDIRDPIQALEFVSILPRLARYGVELSDLLLNRQPAISISDVNEWTKLSQRPADKAWLEAQKQAKAKADTKESEAREKAILGATECDAESKEE